MIIVGPNRKGRTAYAEEIDGQFYLSPFPEVSRANRRPVERYDTREELEAHAARRKHEVVWLTN